MGRKRPVISTSVTETAAGDESPDESERPLPVVMAETDKSPAKMNDGRKSKPKTPSDSNIVPTRASKRTRKPTVHYGHEEEYEDYFTKFKAQNKRRRIKQEIPEDEQEDKDDKEEKEQAPTTSESHADEEELSAENDLPSTSAVKEGRKCVVVAAKNTPSTSTAKENGTVNVKLEIEEVEEPDIIPLGRAPLQQLKRQNVSSEFDTGTLYASANSQEKFRRAIAIATTSNNHQIPYRQYPSQADLRYQQQPTNQHYHLQRQQYDAEGQPRVIVPRSIRNPTATSPFQLQQQHPHHQQLQQYPHQQPHHPIRQLHLRPQQSPLPQYRPIIGAYGTSVINSSLPQYQDKRMKGPSRNPDVPVQCPECNLVLKNAFAYNTHRNYVHGQIQRAQIPCPELGCIVMSTSMVGLARHLNSSHRYCLRHEQHVFKNEQEYMEWFRNLVGDGAVSFIRSSGVKTHEKYNGTVSLMFYCHNAGRKHLNNRAGTIKKNAICPAYFRMTKHQSGHVSVYAQLRHVGHDCSPKYKTIESYPLIRHTISEIESALATFKALAKTTIPAEYPMEKNSLVSSCVEVLNNIRLDFERAKTLIDGIIPGGGGGNDRVEDVEFDEELMNSVAADEDLYALPNPQDSSADGSENAPFRLSASPDNIDEEVQIIKNNIYNSAAKLEVANAAAAAAAAQISPPQTATPSPPGAHSKSSFDLSSSSGKAGPSSSSGKAGPSSSGSKSYKERVYKYRKTPMVLDNGRIQCTLCSVILKSFESYNIHRNTQHGLQTIRTTPRATPQPQFHDAFLGAAEVGIDGQNKKPCAVCQQNFTSSNPSKILFCNKCIVIFHDGCKVGHMAVCPFNAPSRT